MIKTGNMHTGGKEKLHHHSSDFQAIKNGNKQAKKHFIYKDSNTAMHIYIQPQNNASYITKCQS